MIWTKSVARKNWDCISWGHSEVCRMLDRKGIKKIKSIIHSIEHRPTREINPDACLHFTMVGAAA